MATVLPDVRRPAHNEPTLQQLVGELGVFETMRDALVFCAALGFSNQRREEFPANPNTIAWATMAANPLFEQVLLMIVASTAKDSPDDLGDHAIRERVRIFEEYACGGLSIVMEEMGRGLDAEEVVLGLVSRQVATLDQVTENDPHSNVKPFDPFAN